MQVESSLPPEVSVVLPVTPDDAFALLTEPERLRRWKTVSARVDLRAGGTYRWTIIPGHAVEGTYVEVERGRRLVFGWGWSGQADLGPDASTVTVTFEPTAGGTLVRLVHTGLNEEQAASHLAGWRHYLTRLALAVSAGEAGPDEWAAMPDPATDLACAETSLAICQHQLRRLDRPHDADIVDARLRELIEHVAQSLSGLASAVGARPDDPGEHASAEARVAHLGQLALEQWDVRRPTGTVTYRGADSPADAVLSWTAIELLAHAATLADALGAELPAAAAFVSKLRATAQDLRSLRLPDGDLFADRVVTGLDADVFNRLETVVAPGSPGDRTDNDD